MKKTIKLTVKERYTFQGSTPFTRAYANKKFRIVKTDGTVIYSGTTNAKGKLAVIFTTPKETTYKIEFYEEVGKDYWAPEIVSGSDTFVIKRSKPNTQSLTLVKEKRFILQFQLFYQYYPVGSKTLSKKIILEGKKYKIVDNKGKKYYGVTDKKGITKLLSPHSFRRYEIHIFDDATNTYRIPKVHDQSYPAITLKKDTLLEIRLRTYQQFEVWTKKNKPLEGVKLVKIPKGTSSKNLKYVDLVTDANGKTEKIWTAFATNSKVKSPSGKVLYGRNSTWPPKPDGSNLLVKYSIPTGNMHTASDPNHTGQLSGTADVPMIVDLENQRILFVKKEHFAEAEKIASLLERTMGNLASERSQLAKKLSLGQLDGKKIAEQEKAIGMAQADVEDVLNKHFKNKAELQEVFTVQTIRSGKNSQTGKPEYGLRRRYYKKDDYVKLNNSRLNKSKSTFTLNVDKLKASTEKFDRESLKKSFKEISASLEKDLYKSGNKKYDITWLDGLLNTTAHELSESIQLSENLMVDKNAQWLRLAGSAQATSSASWKPLKGDVGVSAAGSMQGKLVLAEGSYKMTRAFPSLKGWMMRIGDADLGCILFKAGFELYGFVGAKGVIAGNVAIEVKNGYQKAKVIKNDPKASLSSVWDGMNKDIVFEPASEHQKVGNSKKDGTNIGADIGIDVFAGAEGSLTCVGSLEWKKPTAREFTPFASVAPMVGGLAGVRGSFNFVIFFSNGKFMVRAKAALCYGLGAVGSIDFQVDAGKILEFLEWVQNQLLNAGFKQLVYISKLAFDALSELCVYVVGEAISDELADQLAQKADEISDKIKKFRDDLDKADARTKLARRIVNAEDRDWLIYATPEAKGMLLYEVTRHMWYSHRVDSPHVSIAKGEVQYLPTHKEAVLTILSTITTKADWDNVLQHRHPTGEKSSETIGKIDGDFLRFLNYGEGFLADESVVKSRMNRELYKKGRKPDTGNDYVDRYLKIRTGLLKEYPKGYDVVRNTTPEYDMLRQMYDGATFPEFYAHVDQDTLDVNLSNSQVLVLDENGEHLNGENGGSGFA